jgi:acetylglutamate kinase
MGLSGSANKRLVSALIGEGIQAVGLSGEDGPLITAQPSEPASMGLVGMPRRVNVALLDLLLEAGYLPVVSPVSRGLADAGGPTERESSAALNVNGDDAAAAIAAAMVADELLLVSDVEGVRSGGALVGCVSPSAVRRMLAGADVTGGMRAKLQAALAAVDSGVRRVRISDLAAIDQPDRGTIVTEGDEK